MENIEMNQINVSAIQQAGQQAVPLERVDTFAGQLERAQVDMQIATARAFPRDRNRALQAIITEVAADPDAMVWRLEFRGRHGSSDKTAAVGPSIRLAEVILQRWGNLRAAASIVESRPEYVRAEGVCWDLETNACVKEQVVVPTVDSNGRPYKDRLHLIHQQVAISKALRNAVLRIVPRSIVTAALNTVKRAAKVDAQTIAGIRAWLRSINVSEQQACAVLGVQSLEQISQDELLELRAIRQSIKDGTMTVAEAFSVEPQPAQAEPTQTQQTQEAKPEPKPSQQRQAQPQAVAPTPAEAPLPQPEEPPVEALYRELEAAGVDRESTAAYLKLVGLNPADMTGASVDAFLRTVRSNAEAVVEEIRRAVANNQQADQGPRRRGGKKPAEQAKTAATAAPAAPAAAANASPQAADEEDVKDLFS